MAYKYDVFLSHNSKDKPLVEIIATRLRDKEKLNPFLDKWNLTPGEPFPDELEHAIKNSKAIAVFVGPQGISPWHHEELRMALLQIINKKHDQKIIPVLLPGADESHLPIYLKARTWVNFRQGIDNPAEFAKLVAGITNATPQQLDTKEKFFFGFPSRDYYKLIGREKELEKILQQLRNPASKPVIAIYGLGGIGKTALAYELSGRCKEDEIFNKTIWASAKRELLFGQEVKAITPTFYNLFDFFETVGSQMFGKEYVQLPLLEKSNKLKATFSEKPLLLVLDNLEFEQEMRNINEKIDVLGGVLGRSRLLITSRHYVEPNDRIYEVRLGGFSLEDSIVFLREESRMRGIERVANASSKILHQIYEATGGSPLAMKLILGQVNRQPLDKILADLQRVSIHSDNYQFYRHIYSQSWEMMTDISRKLLVSMAVFSPETGGLAQDLLEVSELGEKELYGALGQLISFSLIDPVGDLGQTRYTIHQLTHYFILSDIVKAWE